MDTLLIEVTSQKAYNLIKELESLHIIRVLKRTAKPKQKLSDEFAGCLSPETADKMQKELIAMRKEWEKRYLLDTNTVIDFMGDKFNAHAKESISNIIDSEINISVINKIELLGFSVQDPKLVAFVDNPNIYSLEDKIVDVTIEIRRKSKIKLPDSVIAATALVYDLIVITRNIDDFKNVPNLKVINSHKL